MFRQSFRLRSGEILFFTLISDVKNIADIRKKLITGEIKCGFIKPSLVFDTFQVAVAADKAVLSFQRNKQITKNIYTEILYNMSVSTHITQSLQRFGVDDNDRHVMVAFIGSEPELAIILSQVDGKIMPLENTKDLTNIEKLKKIYGIKGPELSVTPLLDSVVSRIACKSLL